jgi:hypothetical protein
MRKAIAVMALLCCCASTTALAQVSFAFDSPGVSIAVNVPVYPDLVRVPGYPVYYAPQLRANYFFYDGLYWVFADGEWYASPWYNGPWQLVADDAVPLFVLRVPVRYYRAPPSFFRGWAFNAPPRWGEHWGARWEEHHRGWDHWNRSAVPAPAPLPVYQRNYTGNRYPRNVEEQRTLETRNYHYQPRDRFAQQHVQRGAPVQNAQAPRPVTRSNTANAPRPREESPQRAGGTPPTVAHRTPQPGPHAESPAVAQRHAPVTEQHAQAPRPEQRAQAPRPEQRAQAPRPEPRAQAPRPEQHAQTPRPEQHAQAPRPEQHAQAPRPEQRAQAPRPEPRAQAPRPEQHAATPRPEQHAAPRQRAQQSAPPVARGPAQPPQAQGHAPGNKGPAQAEHGGNENARAGERRNEHNG